jgi:hypothetical protein
MPSLRTLYLMRMGSNLAMSPLSSFTKLVSFVCLGCGINALPAGLASSSQQLTNITVYHSPLVSLANGKFCHPFMMTCYDIFWANVT